MSVLAALALVALSALPVAAQEPAPRMGGVLKAAMIGEPPTLDMHWTTAVITQQIMWHVYEDVGRIKFGDYFILDVTRKELRGFRTAPDLFFWNAWLASR